MSLGDICRSLAPLRLRTLGIFLYDWWRRRRRRFMTAETEGGGGGEILTID
jgi:hypothetical protein